MRATTRYWPAFALVAFASFSKHGAAADLPPHAPLDVLIVADAVNPNRLADAELTQPQDFGDALAAPDSGLSLASVSTVDSQCVDDALAALAGEPAPDVVLYFAHRGAHRCDGSDAQAELTRLVDDGLRVGMGLVAFHHGLYLDIVTPGAKDEMLQLIGAQYEGINWSTDRGQRVFDVSGGHFVATNNVNYDGTEAFRGTYVVPVGEYPYFDNVPDELYPTLTLLESEGEVRLPLLATDTQGERLLSYALQRPDYAGWVVTYQPGEYQPNALDDRDGPNFQILANALYYAGTQGGTSAPTTGAVDGGAEVQAGADSGAGNTAPGGTAAGTAGGEPPAAADSGGGVGVAGGAPGEAAGGAPVAGAELGGAGATGLPSAGQGASGASPTEVPSTLVAGAGMSTGAPALPVAGALDGPALNGSPATDGAAGDGEQGGCALVTVPGSATAGTWWVLAAAAALRRRQR